MDACGVGALPDAADYGDAGTNTLGHLAELAGGLGLPPLPALGPGAGLPPPRATGAARAPPPTGPREGLHHRALGADGRRHPTAAADIPRRLSGRRRRVARGR